MRPRCRSRKRDELVRRVEAFGSTALVRAVARRGRSGRLLRGKQTGDAAIPRMQRLQRCYAAVRYDDLVLVVDACLLRGKQTGDAAVRYGGLVRVVDASRIASGRRHRAAGGIGIAVAVDSERRQQGLAVTHFGGESVELGVNGRGVLGLDSGEVGDCGSDSG
ncbi:hypothetical protein BDV95DRAFT_593655 [Massariosphaeria phaeospora]|uniref:Uncharacterized protein n=1 Tax=Massariosphaeria phaeospora TaxID=100035 RepID=A0A7C8MLN7_9PLEO|nr:hypothetical protein BDV95DRAFT_593655 [Massariosphaeria phaeospora]